MLQWRSQLLIRMIFSETHFTYLQKHVLINNQASVFAHQHVSWLARKKGRFWLARRVTNEKIRRWRDKCVDHRFERKNEFSDDSKWPDARRALSLVLLRLRILTSMTECWPIVLVHLIVQDYQQQSQQAIESISNVQARLQSRFWYKRKIRLTSLTFHDAYMRWRSTDDCPRSRQIDRLPLLCDRYWLKVSPSHRLPCLSNSYVWCASTIFKCAS